MPSYQTEREEFIARVLAEGLSLTAARTLLREATKINRLAELACSSEAADRDRINCPAMPTRTNPNPRGACLCDGYWDTTTDPKKRTWIHADIPRIRLQDYRAEQRAIAAVPADWRVITEGDPRGYTLRVIPPSYAERNEGRDRHNLDAIGVPAGPSRLRF